MIKTFKCKETKKIWEGTFSLHLPNNIQEIARRKLRMLNNAKVLEDLRIPPKNCLEALGGKRKGEHSIRINKQWRLCFKWIDGDAFEARIQDYH
ncbi:MAG: type II toxin-antitoxin system RelE/ParE family toxin [Gammaproteobacteria bacterium]